MKSFLSHLECTYCGDIFSSGEPNRLCEECGKVLYPRYDVDEARKEFTRESLNGRAPNMWRYFEMMPILDEKNVVSLGEGFTPILRAKRLSDLIGVQDIRIKDESLNPTASFKARGLSAAVSKAKELGIKRLTMPSAGNAAGAMSCYAARAGMDAYVYMPKDAPDANQIEVQMSGGNLNLIDGLISDAGIISREKAAQLDLFDVSTLQEPYRVEGKKTMGYEIAEQFNWVLPDVIIYPTGGGTGIVGMWKAFEERQNLGWIDSKIPRMYAVQAEGCAPIVRAFHNGDTFAKPWEGASTFAAGIRAPGAIGDYLILDALRSSLGGAVEVTDGEILEMMKQITSNEGIFVCPEGAATAVALQKFLADGLVSAEEQVLLLNTGSGLKYLDLIPSI